MYTAEKAAQSTNKTPVMLKGDFMSLWICMIIAAWDNFNVFITFLLLVLPGPCAKKKFHIENLGFKIEFKPGNVV